MKQGWIFLAIIFATFVTVVPALRVTGAITLKDFQVSYVPTRVRLRWETESELDNLGFLVKKKITGSSGNFETVKLCAKATPCSEAEKQEFIFAEGGNIRQIYGNFFDDEIQPDISYTYQLIAVDTSQQEEVVESKTVYTSFYLYKLFLPLTYAERFWGFAVDLKYFDLSWTANRVKLRWETGIERNNLGFFVRKKLVGNSGDFETVKLCAKSTICDETEKVDFVFSGGSDFGNHYGDFFDDNIEQGKIYTYQLFAIDKTQREVLLAVRTVITFNLNLSPSNSFSGLDESLFGKVVLH